MPKPTRLRWTTKGELPSALENQSQVSAPARRTKSCRNGDENAPLGRRFPVLWICMLSQLQRGAADRKRYRLPLPPPMIQAKLIPKSPAVLPPPSSLANPFSSTAHSTTRITRGASSIGERVQGDFLNTTAPARLLLPNFSSASHPASMAERSDCADGLFLKNTVWQYPLQLSSRSKRRSRDWLAGSPRSSWLEAA